MSFISKYFTYAGTNVRYSLEMNYTPLRQPLYCSGTFAGTRTYVLSTEYEYRCNTEYELVLY